MPEEKQKEKSSAQRTLLIVLVIAAVAGLAYFFLFMQAQPEAAKAFKVTVLGADGEKVSGATVQVLDGGELIAEENTTDGVAEFMELPEKPLTFKVTTPDGETKTQIVDTSKKKTLKADFTAEATPEPGVEEVPAITLKVIDSQTSRPISSAKIVYSIGKTSQVINSKQDGTAQFAAQLGIAVRIRVSAAGYYTQTSTIITKQEMPPIALNAKPQSASITFSPDEQQTVATAGKLFIITEDIESGAPVSNGTACAYAAETGEQLGCAEIVEGNSEITNLTIGAKVHYSVTGADGYYDFSSSQNNGEPATVSELAIAHAKMQKLDQKLYDLGVKRYTTITTVDEQNNPFPAMVAIIPYPSIIPFPSKACSGSLQLQLADTTTYYAIAYASGMLAARSNEFSPGASVQLVLKSATPDNSAKLSVIATDEDGVALSGATTTVLSDGLLAALPAYTTASYSAPTPTPAAVPTEALPEGVETIETPTPAPEEAAFVPQKPKADFILPVNAEYEVRAFFQKGSGSATTYLASDTELPIMLLVNTGFLDVTAKDLLTGAPVDASFTLYQADAIMDACGGTECTLKARALTEGKIVATAAGYASTTRPLTYEDVNAGETASLNMFLVPSNALNGTMARFTGLTDEKGMPVEGGAVRKNASYTANFFVASTSGERTGFYARTGVASDVANDNAFILDFAAPNGMDLQKSTTYRPGATCIDLENTVAAQGWKWADISFAGSGTANVAIPFSIKATAAAGDKATLNYRAYSYSTTATGSRVYVRSPEDNELGSGENNSAKAECYAKTNSTSFEIIAAKAPEKPAGEKEPTAEFSAGDTVVFDPLKGLQSASGLDRYDLQIDSVFPADAMPVKLKSKNAICSVLLSIQSDNPATRNCYRYDNGKQLFSFQSRELNAECPVHVEGNKLMLNGREFKGEEKLSLYFKVGGCDLQSNLTMPVRVVVAEAEGIFALPNGDSMSDSEAAKPLYVVNNMQAGSRQVSANYLPLNANTSTSKNVSFSLPGAKAIAWRGPGTLSFLEGNETINEIFYENPVKQLEKGLGAVGGQRVTSCTDFKCCASGWCTRKALKQMITAFNEKAKSIASKTAFRRGGSEPFASLVPSGKFTFATVAQGIQGSDSLLQQQNVSLASTSVYLPKTDAANSNASQLCAKDQPAIYEVTASGKDADSLSLTASVLPLYNNNYVEGCNATPSTQDFIPLCSFLYGVGNCINATNNSNILTTNQLANLTYKIQLCMYPALPVISLPYCLPTCAASAAYTSASKQSICASMCAIAALAGNIAAGATGTTCQAACQTKYSSLVASTAPTVMNKMNVFTIEGEIPDYGEATEHDAFGKLGNALVDAFSFSGNADYKPFDNAAFFDFGAGTCNDITTDFQSQLINAGMGAALSQVQQGVPGTQQPAGQVNPANLVGGLIDSWLPVLATTCTCGVPQTWQGFQVWPPQFGGSVVAGPLPYPQFFNKYTPAPICGGVTGTLSTIGGTPTGTGKAGSININVQGNQVMFRVDLGVNGNCNLIPPWSLDWWRSIATPTNAFALFSYLLGTNRNDIALSLSTTVESVSYQRTVAPAGGFRVEETTVGSDGTRKTSYMDSGGGQVIETVKPDGSVSHQAFDKEGKAVPFEVEQNGVKLKEENIQGIMTKTFTYQDGSKVVYTTDASGQQTITYSSKDGASTVVTDGSGKVTSSAGTTVKKGETYPPAGPDKKAGAPTTEQLPKGKEFQVNVPPQPSFPATAPGAVAPGTPGAQPATPPAAGATTTGAPGETAPAPAAPAPVPCQSDKECIAPARCSTVNTCVTPSGKVRETPNCGSALTDESCRGKAFNDACTGGTCVYDGTKNTYDGNAWLSKGCTCQAAPSAPAATEKPAATTEEIKQKLQYCFECQGSDLKSLDPAPQTCKSGYCKEVADCTICINTIASASWTKTCSPKSALCSYVVGATLK